MTLQLVLLRHAKALRDPSAPSDHARALSDRGHRQAAWVGRVLLEAGIVPDRVIASDSLRTTETADGVLAQLPHPPALHTTRTLYHAGLGALQQVVTPLGLDVATVLVLGHNPGMETAASWLSGELLGFSTATAVVLRREASSWAQALEAEGSWTVVHYLVPPRDL